MDNSEKEMRKLRLSIGFLGLILPFLLFFGNKGELLGSISHYYYTSSSIFFIGIIFSFAMILFSYQGYEKTDKEKVSDNFITSLAAFFALVTVIVPTSSEGSLGEIIFHEHPYLYGHKDNLVLNFIHLLSAGIFISLLGFMAYFKFTLSPNNSPRLNKFYRICGILIWLSIIMILIFIVLEKTGIFSANKSGISFYVWWFECIAIVSFAVAWIIKSKPKKIFINPNNE